MRSGFQGKDTRGAPVLGWAPGAPSSPWLWSEQAHSGAGAHTASALCPLPPAEHVTLCGRWLGGSARVASGPPRVASRPSPKGPTGLLLLGAAAGTHATEGGPSCRLCGLETSQGLPTAAQLPVPLCAGPVDMVALGMTAVAERLGLSCLSSSRATRHHQSSGSAAPVAGAGREPGVVGARHPCVGGGGAGCWRGCNSRWHLGEAAEGESSDWLFLSPQPQPAARFILCGPQRIPRWVL